MRNIVLRANDGADHTIGVAAASLCKTLASLLQDLEGARFFMSGHSYRISVLPTCGGEIHIR